jgi:ankyrin repeat protein
MARRKAGAALWMIAALSLLSSARADSLSEADLLIRTGDFAGAVAVLSGDPTNPEAQLRLAALLRTGKGVARDDARALALTTAAATAGLAEAQYRLARMALDGVGMAPDPLMAATWAERAAAQGHAQALSLLVTLSQPVPPPVIVIPEGDDPVSPPRQSALAVKLGLTPLMEAAASGSSRRLHGALADDTAVDAVDPAGRTALMHAVDAGAVENVAALIAAGARVDLRDGRGLAALDLAVAANRPEIARSLVLAGADPMLVPPQGGATPLLAALRAGHCEVAMAIAPLVPVNLPDLNRAAAARCDGTVLLLLAGAAGLAADVEQIDESGRSLLWHAASTGNAAALDVLIAAGADPSRADAAGVAPIRIAAATGNAAVSRLIAAGAQPDAGAELADGNTALILAADRGDVATVAALIAAGARIDHRNALQESALMAAARRGWRPVVEALLEAGADPGLRNFRGERAADLARMAGHDDLAARLQD